ncbi:hypothetical protein ACFOMD_14770 [Sphingoaurantiacus capsulatus]|uniref:Uncharacterized protein n=1 Tax=Sphingoaurantiacus capsulatus TaxID=1771310 RepID=A0ABV7XEW5_9SPHN
MMSKRASGPRPVASSGSIIIWLAGLVFGVSAGLLMVYHFLMANNVASTLPIDSKPGVLSSSSAAEAKTVNAAHTAAMKEALKTETN